MTAFTDDLDNDLEVLAEHHEVTLVQVAKATLSLLPTHVRLPLLRALLDALPQPVSEDPPSFIQERTGLPQALRGAVHELTRRYQPNLIVDAAMLEMPEDVRQNVARAFLPKKASPEAPLVRSEYVERSTGKVLHEEDGEHFGPANLRITHEDGSYTLYLADRMHRRGLIETDLLPYGSKVIRTYYFEDAEQ